MEDGTKARKRKDETKILTQNIVLRQPLESVDVLVLHRELVSVPLEQHGPLQPLQSVQDTSLKGLCLLGQVEDGTQTEEDGTARGRVEDRFDFLRDI